jgi:hypothetical protein
MKKEIRMKYVQLNEKQRALRALRVREGVVVYALTQEEKVARIRQLRAVKDMAYKAPKSKEDK